MAVMFHDPATDVHRVRCFSVLGVPSLLDAVDHGIEAKERSGDITFLFFNARSTLDGSSAVCVGPSLNRARAASAGRRRGQRARRLRTAGIRVRWVLEPDTLGSIWL